MKRLFCIVFMLYMLFLAWALADSIPSGSVNSLPELSFPDFPEMDTDSWFSGITPPEGWKDLIPDDFGTFPEDWGSFGDMGDWSARFEAFKQQVSGEKESGESSFPDMSDPMKNLQDVFGDSLSKESADPNQNSELRDLLTQAFGLETTNQEPIMPELPVSREDLEGTVSLSGSDQMDYIAGVLGIPPEAGSDASAETLGSLPDFAPASYRDLVSAFSEQSDRLQTTMDVSSDRYKSLYSTGNSNQKNASQESRKSLYSPD